MDKQAENILTTVLFVGVSLHFSIGLFFYDKLPVGNIGKICLFFSMDVQGFVLFLLSHKKVFKGLGALGMILGSYLLYKELVTDNSLTEKDYLTMGLLFSNCYFIWLITDKLKNKTK